MFATQLPTILSQLKDHGDHLVNRVVRAVTMTATKAMEVNLEVVRGAAREAAREVVRMDPMPTLGPS